MPGTGSIQLECNVLKALENGRFRVQLANGHQFVARFVRRRQAEVAEVDAGSTILVRLSPSDMSQGLIETILTKKHNESSSIS